MNSNSFSNLSLTDSKLSHSKISYWRYKTRYNSGTPLQNLSDFQNKPMTSNDRLPDLNHISFSVVRGDSCQTQNFYSLRVYNMLPNNKKLFLTSDWLRSVRSESGRCQVFRLPPGNYLDLGPIGGFGSIWISVGKGFGPGYVRKEIIECPLWMEVVV